MRKQKKKKLEKHTRLLRSRQNAFYDGVSRRKERARFVQTVLSTLRQCCWVGVASFGGENRLTFRTVICGRVHYIRCFQSVSFFFLRRATNALASRNIFLEK